MNDALHAERPNGNRCPPECGIGLVHALRCPTVHPEMAEVPPLPEGWAATALDDGRSRTVAFRAPCGEYAIAAAGARAIGLALIHAAAVAEERDRG